MEKLCRLAVRDRVKSKLSKISEYMYGVVHEIFEDKIRITGEECRKVAVFWDNGAITWKYDFDLEKV